MKLKLKWFFQLRLVKKTWKYKLIETSHAIHAFYPLLLFTVKVTLLSYASYQNVFVCKKLTKFEVRKRLHERDYFHELKKNCSSL